MGKSTSNNIENIDFEKRKEREKTITFVEMNRTLFKQLKIKSRIFFHHWYIRIYSQFQMILPIVVFFSSHEWTGHVEQTS